MPTDHTSNRLSKVVSVVLIEIFTFERSRDSKQTAAVWRQNSRMLRLNSWQWDSCLDTKSTKYKSWKASRKKKMSKLTEVKGRSKPNIWTHPPSETKMNLRELLKTRSHLRIRKQSIWSYPRLGEKAKVTFISNQS